MFGASDMIRCGGDIFSPALLAPPIHNSTMKQINSLFIIENPWSKFLISAESPAIKNYKKSPAFFEDRGLIGNINPHNILTPKTVRGHPGRSSGSPTSVRLPSPDGQWHFRQRKRPRFPARPGLQRRVRSRFKRDSLRLDVIVLYVSVFIAQETDKVKRFNPC